MSRIDKLCERMRYWCTKANLGYDQYQRWDIRVGGESDCSSLVYWCLWEAGFLSKPTGSLYNHTLYTGTLRRHLVEAGFTVHAVNGNPQKGDVLLNDNHHVAIYLGNGQLAQSSIDERGKATGGQSGDQGAPNGRGETNVRSYYNYPWSCYLRPPADPAPKPKRNTKRPTGKESGAKGGPVYRLYNPGNGDHFYTVDKNEYEKLATKGWKQEGVAWNAPNSGKKTYRLYNASSGQHIWTVSLHEAQTLWDLGWEFEGVTWYSSGNKAVWRLYNPGGDGQHLYTTSNDEQASCVRAGWRQEGIGFDAVR